MSRWRRAWIVAGAISGLAAVAFGAVASHLLEIADPTRLDLAWRFHAFHVVTILAVALGMPPGLWTQLALCGFFLGSMLFCGTLYYAAVVPEASTSLAPLGGGLLMLGWLLLAVTAVCTSGRGIQDARSA